MDVDFNGRFLERPPTGVDRFALETLQSLDALLAAHPGMHGARRYRVLVPSSLHSRPQFKVLVLTPVGRLGGTLWEQAELPWAARGRLLVNLCNTAPMSKLAQICVIHDAATVRVPYSYSRKFRWWYALMMPWIYRRSARVLTVSEFSRRDLEEVYGARFDGVGVLPEGADHMHRLRGDVTVLSRHGLGDRPFILAVSSMAPHKNFRAVVEALGLMQRQDVDVVVAGGTNPAVFARAVLPDRVKHAGYVSDAELKALFEHAACFVFPSIYEGFGLPPIEAMACSCPVLAAQAASIPEVCGEAARYFDPHDASGLASALDELLGDEGAQEELRQLGAQRSAQMRWELTATVLLGHIDEYLKGSA